MDSHSSINISQQQDVVGPTGVDSTSRDWRAWPQYPPWADPPFMFEHRLTDIGKLLRMHTNCVLSKFLLNFKSMGFHECKQFTVLLNIIHHLSKVIFREDTTRSFCAEDKQRLKENWVAVISHQVATVNIFLFFIRRGYLRITGPLPRYKLKVEWNQELVGKAIQEQVAALEEPEESSGAWIMAHFLENRKACKTLLNYPENIPSNAIISEVLLDM